MAIGTAPGFSDGATVALAVVLAFALRLRAHEPAAPAGRAGARGGGPDRPRLRHALASRRWRSSTTRSSLASRERWRPASTRVLFWGSLAFALAIACVLTVPVNRWLLARGKGHAAVHETGIHGGPPSSVIKALAAAAFVFGSAVLLAELVG